MIYLEPVGTGESGRLATADEYCLDAYVRFLAAVVDHLGQERVYLLGHSYGGFVVMKYALQYPDRFAGLILYGTSPVTGPDFWAAAMAAVTAYPQQYPDIPEAAAIPAAFQQLETATDDDSLSRAFAAAVPIYFADFWARQAEFAPFRPVSASGLSQPRRRIQSRSTCAHGWLRSPRPPWSSRASTISSVARPGPFNSPTASRAPS